MAVLEAMAAGLPVVVTPVGGLPDLVEDAVTGLVVPVDDVAALSAAIARLVGDEPLRLALGRAARDRVTPYGLDAYGERLISLYEPLLHRSIQPLTRTGPGPRSAPPRRP
jgi:glycosyltransferase involved in cell wall biosynthesis